MCGLTQKQQYILSSNKSLNFSSHKTEYDRTAEITGEFNDQIEYHKDKCSNMQSG